MTKTETKEIKPGKIIPRVKPHRIENDAADEFNKAISSLFYTMSWVRDMTEGERTRFFRRIKPAMASLYEVSRIGLEPSEPPEPKITRKEKVKQ